ncbi:MAG TPA: LuxR C-terminal-related transcriptional regulator [Solirubrobacteraceae bacterium]|nr:LuxR C-terminal-related transcriptional regulator [Solirubrobacteraceae bacterium]
MALAMNSAAATTFLWARAHVALLRGDLAGAEADLRACGEYAERIGALNPVVEPWRSQLALVLAAAGDRPGSSAEPAELVAAELAIALRSGLARGVGVALRAQGVLAGGAEGVDLLAESVTVLRGSPAVLELAESLRAHGAALRRLGRVLEAREVLREALDLAMRCGAGALVAQVRSELHVAGARPRGPWTHGVEALTPSELRVARLAALGLTNPEIASELVVSVKTVKHHLGAVFRKLDVASRRDLAGVVDPADTHLDNSHEPLLSMRVHRGVEQSGSSSGS